MNHTLILLLISIGVVACKTTPKQPHNENVTKEMNKENHTYTNDLIHESSPYLLQHAHNPVDWLPWGEKALAKAKTENKLLIISIGYAACHWCHVMEHESFEDSLVAEMMNKYFIPIKVDREERPDIDNVYMNACHLSSGRGCGWPLNAFAMPDGRPIWAGTYFPKKNWLGILQQFIDLQEKNPKQLNQYANQMEQGMKQQVQVPIQVGDIYFNPHDVQNICKKMVESVDMKLGGRKVNGGQGNKFPMPTNWSFLLREYALTGNEKAKNAALFTLDEMAKGGIYDQIGGGFARYATDPRWKVPHFEKMLYDNGQLVSLYAQAYQLTKEKRYKQVIEQTLDFIARKMTDETGGFYSSYDADSEGEEGKFYVFTQAEIAKIIPDKQAAKVFGDYFNILPNGNWEQSNILHITQPLSDIATQNNISLAEAETIINNCISLVLAARNKRVYPSLDDKILTAWNALMCKGYTDAYRALGHEKYKKAAIKNGQFIIQHAMQSDGRLNRNYKDGKSVINAFLDDYALTIQSFIALYEITFDEIWLKKAVQLTDYAITHFTEEQSGMFYYTSDLDAPLVIRDVDTGDNVIPSSNSSMAKSLFLLGTLLGREDYLQRAKKMTNNMKADIVQHPQPSFFTNWATVLSLLTTPPYEVAILGSNFEEKRKELEQYFLPNTLFLGGNKEGSLDLLQGKLQEGETYIYVCQNKVCKRPTQSVQEALKLIKRL